jgi:hypothetical protein
MIPDLAKMRGEEAFLKKAMAKFGIKLNIADAIGALASTIRDHAHFERLITEAEPEMRQEFYDSVRPHLKFRAKPLDVYISDAKQMAEREQLPILADGKLLPFKPARDVASSVKDAEQAIARGLAERTLRLTCSKCLVEGIFYQVGAETKVGVMMKVRRAGWVYDPVNETETCPQCAEGERGR